MSGIKFDDIYEKKLLPLSWTMKKKSILEYYFVQKILLFILYLFNIYSIILCINALCHRNMIKISGVDFIFLLLFYFLLQ